MSGPWVIPSGVQQFEGDASSIAQQYGIPILTFLNQIAEESGFAQNRTSYAGAVGIAQIVPTTGANPGYGVTPDTNPGSNPIADLTFMAQYDAAMYTRTGSWSGALAAYNAGLGNTQAGMGYANDILGGKWTNSIQSAGGTSVGSSAFGGASATGTSSFGGVDPFSSMFGNAISGAGAVTAMVTGQPVYNQGQTITPGMGFAAATKTVTENNPALNQIAGTISALFTPGNMTKVAVVILALVVIAGGLIMLGRQPITVQLQGN